MDFINPLIAQLRDLFASMTPGARITAGLLLTVVVVSFGFLFQQTGSSPDGALFGAARIPADQLTHIEAAMAEAGLANYEIKNQQVFVPSSQKDQYLAAIASANALPPNYQSIMKGAFEGASLLETREQWKQRTKSAREAQLSHIIGLMNWVEYSTVMYEIDKGYGINPKDKAAANVFVVPVAGESLNNQRMRALQKLVAGWHPSLLADNVNITSGGDSDIDVDGGYTDPLMLARDAFEKDKRSDLLRELSFIPGVRIEVSAEFENIKERQTVDVTPSATPTVLSETTETEETASQVGDSGGRVGTEAQGPGRTGTDSRIARNTNSTTKRGVTQTENMVGSKTETSIYSGYAPREVFASVAIPRDYILSVWRKRNPDSDAEQQPDINALRSYETEIITNVENLVQPLLPKLSLGEDEFTQVNVAVIDAISPDPIEPPAFSTVALGWASQYWTTLSLVGLAGFSLLMMRTVVAGGKSGGEEEPPILQLEMPEEDELEEEEEEDENSIRPKLKLKKDRSLKDDLAEVVRDDPEAAAAILRNWIGAAS